MITTNRSIQKSSSRTLTNVWDPFHGPTRTWNVQFSGGGERERIADEIIVCTTTRRRWRRFGRTWRHGDRDRAMTPRLGRCWPDAAARHVVKAARLDGGTQTAPGPHTSCCQTVQRRWSPELLSATLFRTRLSTRMERKKKNEDRERGELWPARRTRTTEHTPSTTETRAANERRPYLIVTSSAESTRKYSIGAVALSVRKFFV